MKDLIKRIREVSISAGQVAFIVALGYGLFHGYQEANSKKPRNLNREEILINQQEQTRNLQSLDYSNQSYKTNN